MIGAVVIFSITVPWVLLVSGDPSSLSKEEVTGRRAVNLAAYGNARIKYVQRIWRPMSRRDLLGYSLSVLDIQHAGLLVTLTDAHVTELILHKLPDHGTIVDDPRYMKDGKQWNTWGNKIKPTVSPPPTVRQLVEVGGDGFDAFKDNCILTARRMLKLAAPAEHYDRGLKGLVKPILRPFIMVPFRDFVIDGALLMVFGRHPTDKVKPEPLQLKPNEKYKPDSHVGLQVALTPENDKLLTNAKAVAAMQQYKKEKLVSEDAVSLSEIAEDVEKDE